MRIAELSRSTGVPAPTIKYYLREGLLPPGERTSRNQAQYDERHVRRIKLVRALVEVGGLSIATARDVLARMDAPEHGLLTSLGKVQFAMSTPPSATVEDEVWDEAVRRVDELIERRGWRSVPSNPARKTLASVLATLQRLGQTDKLDLLDSYADAAERIVDDEIEVLLRRPDLDSLAEGLVVWIALGDVMFSALRRIAQESAATPRLPDSGEAPGGTSADADDSGTGPEGPAPES
ncbi:MerR family transcriptional regulator [Streptomonospora nanhaiensis]|uniref:DNA-binding transcriptional MerR regulator n=1 Tax=Streptomonospora nanhaiensis TaxID=1323731 RepID=A0A853BL29_9ACTN|nr:MerR family transcriptional regulator [Streptomonospora nanhaiensis]MBV2362906.1 MerR family transcriptional regulator [Streptomonospora nanhaiensis]MBX9391688.1 MerR family transcriptional regulator [Streptomonospora nanhaiensis]NYI95266.1 DNA-binding transcriptional MerR regulator [Streptomonospora nanhaiensis]